MKNKRATYALRFKPLGLIESGVTTVNHNLADRNRAVYVLAAVLAAPILILVIGYCSRTNPLDGKLPYSLLIAVPLSLWIATRRERHVGTNRIPGACSKAESVLFGLARSLELIALLWLPSAAQYMGSLSDLFGFVLFAKAALFLNYAYWVLHFVKLDRVSKDVTT
jgi:hypothetical protein